ncbi:MAG TPA: Co2+/Mg2+ efflux protein ApaG [Chryseolinea sp.]|nr:Co2+/Mg2+ efflux protein ApaG [Chryseolinea sp.]
MTSKLSAIAKNTKKELIRLASYQNKNLNALIYSKLPVIYQVNLANCKKLIFLKRMVTEITQGIKVSVETEYQPAYSSPSQYHYVFTYRISIENHSEFTIQLLRRHWHIYDAGFSQREVEGEGVVGQQPVLEPGQTHQYVSGCNLKSGLGKMLGTYLMERVVDGVTMHVNIPEFTMIAPIRLN